MLFLGWNFPIEDALLRCMKRKKLLRYLLTSKYSYLKQIMNLESRGLGKSFDKSKMSPLPQWLFSPNFGKEKRRTWCHYSDISFYSEVIKKESQACKHVNYEFLTPAF